MYTAELVSRMAEAYSQGMPTVHCKTRQHEALQDKQDETRRKGETKVRSDYTKYTRQNRQG